jgi:penicillin-binding protein 1A
MLKGSRAYNPVVNPERSRARRNVVLASMVADGKMSDAERSALRDKAPAGAFQPAADPAGPAPHFASTCANGSSTGPTKTTTTSTPTGLIVHTDDRLRLQDAALQAVARQADMLQTIADVEWGRKSTGVAATTPEAYAKLRGQGRALRVLLEDPRRPSRQLRPGDARIRRRDPGGREGRPPRSQSCVPTLSSWRACAAPRRGSRRASWPIDPSSGEIRAWVGGRNFEADQFDHAVQAERQPGSTFKPFVYRRGAGTRYQPGSHLFR